MTRNGAEQVNPVAELHSTKKHKLHGRAFYESLGSPRLVLAPMVDQSEFIWRLLVRSFFPEQDRSKLLAYTPMFHARIFAETPKYRNSHFQAVRGNSQQQSSNEPVQVSSSTDTSYQPHLDGNPSNDRPLFVQFCANEPDALLAAAKLAQPFCDAVDLNLGCPQGIARRGHYGAFLQEDQPLIHSLIRTLHEQLDVPMTAKIRMLETRDATLAYARGILDAGASIITVHGRRRDMKGHATGLADWSMIRYLRDNLPPDTVIFANGNVLQHGDLARCLAATGADAVMTAEGALCDPSVLAAAPPPAEVTGSREYWYGRDGKGGYRMDAVFRRYLDLIHRHVLGEEPPQRAPLFVPADGSATAIRTKRPLDEEADEDADGEPTKRRKLTKAEKKAQKRRMHKQRRGAPDVANSPNLSAMRPHLFNMLRPLVAKHTHVRDALARCPAGDVAAFEEVLKMVEHVTKEGILESERDAQAEENNEGAATTNGHHRDDLQEAALDFEDDPESSQAAVERCRRPWWICQPYVRPLPKEALEKGALRMKKAETEKEKPRIEGSGIVEKTEEKEPVLEGKEVGQQVVDADCGAPKAEEVLQNGKTLERSEGLKEGLVAG